MNKVDLEIWDMAGPLSPMRVADAERDWVTIKNNGECNRDIRLPAHIPPIMEIRVKDWLECDLADYQAFSLCQLTGGNCAVGFLTNENFDADACPWGVVTDELTGKQACCYTVLVDGVTVLDLLPVVQDYIDGTGKPPRQVEAFRKWARGMMNFYKAQKHAAWKDGS